MKPNRLHQLSIDLVERSFVLETRAIQTKKIDSKMRVDVGNPSPLEQLGVGPVVLPIDTSITEGSVLYYLEIIRQNRLSWLLFDGSVIQISYEMEGSKLIRHRYCYIPAPFGERLSELGGVAQLDVIESYALLNLANQPRRTIVRVEYDLDETARSHPIAHMHFNSPKCRMPMKSCIDVGEFIFFIYRSFYSEEFPEDMISAPRFRGVQTIRPAEMRSFHLNWRLG